MKKINKRKKHNNLLILLFCFIISFLFLFLASKNSFIYKFNDWEDVHAFFTVGKSLFNGKVIFKDIFEQKGPYLYLIYGVAYLINNTNFIGVFIFEILSFTIFLFYIYKIIDLYLDKKYIFIIIPIIAMLTVVFTWFRQGGGCEEFILPMLTIIMYILLKYVKYDEINYIKIFIVGLFTGIIFLTKYTLIGPGIAFMFYLFFDFIRKKKYKEILIFIGVYLLGVVITIIPWLIYFIINDGLFEFIDVYFYKNIFYYSKNAIPIFIRLLLVVPLFIFNLLDSGYIAALLIVFSIMLFMIGKFDKKEKLAVLCMFLFTNLFVYIGATYFDYYSFVYVLYLVFLFIVIFKKIKIDIHKGLIVLEVVLCLILIYMFSPNTKFINKPYDYYAPYKFKDIILKEKNPKILNYGWIDCGFYTVTNTIPNVRYFEKMNFFYKVYSENIDEQNKYIKNKEVDFVIFVEPFKNLLDFPISEYLDINYELIEVFEPKYEYPVRRFKLYKLKK